MGNVILPFDPLKPCRVLAERCRLTPGRVAQFIYGNNLERWFEQGRIDGHQFTRRVSEVLDLELDHDEFHDLWVDMFTENREVSRIVRELKPNHRLILLSNTNPWHWEYARERFTVVSEFDDRVLSYEEGVLKPHPAIYRAALEKTDRSAPVIFIDDVETNVAGAGILGITGLVFCSATQLRQDLTRMGCCLK